MVTVPASQSLDSFLNQRKVCLVLSCSVCTEVSEVIAQQHVGSCVVGVFPEVVEDIVTAMVKRAAAPEKVVPFTLINAVLTIREPCRRVVLPVGNLFGNAGDVEEAVVMRKRICGEAEDDVTRFGSAPDHRLADRERQEPAFNTRRSTVIRGELIVVDLGHTWPQLFAWSSEGLCASNQRMNRDMSRNRGSLALRWI